MDPTTQEVPQTTEDGKFYMMEVSYRAKQNIVVVAENEEQAKEYALASVPPYIDNFEINSLSEKTAPELEELFAGMAEAAKLQASGSLVN